MAVRNVLYLTAALALALSQPQSDQSGPLIPFCIQDCMDDMLDAASNPNFQPANIWLSDDTYEELASEYDGACDTMRGAIDCFGTCPNGGQLIAQQMDGHPTLQLCDEMIEEFKTHILKCFVDNRQEFVTNCGGRDKVTEINGEMMGAIDIARQIMRDPLSASTPDFFQKMGKMCGAVADLYGCMRVTINDVCSDISQGSLSRLMGQATSQMEGVDKQMLGAISPECARMAEVVTADLDQKELAAIEEEAKLEAEIEASNGGHLFEPEPEPEHRRPDAPGHSPVFEELAVHGEPEPSSARTFGLSLSLVAFCVLILV